MTMVELIKGLASVRDGLTLIAFLSLVLLLALRTKKVPELVFGLVRDKLTRQQFYALLNRVLTLGFIAFTAQEMLIYLNRQKGDFAGAAAAWEGAVKLARERGDAVALARLDNTGVPADLPAREGDTDLIGSSTPFAKGGEDYETAAALSP